MTVTKGMAMPIERGRFTLVEGTLDHNHHVIVMMNLMIRMMD